MEACKIMYKGIENGRHVFVGLIGMPEEPVQGPDEYNLPFAKKVKKWKEQVESIKSNAPDIVNWKDHIDIFAAASDGLGTVSLSMINAVVEVKPGDIFDLPNRYEFKEEYEVCTSITLSTCNEIKEGRLGCKGFCKQAKKVLRIVKTESGLRNRLNEPSEMREQPDFLVKTEVKSFGKCQDCGCELNEGEAKTFTVCDACWDKAFKKAEPEESQKELWEEVLKYCEEHYINDIRVREHIEKHFVIQRKK